MESWLGDRIRKRLESRKDEIHLALNGQENFCRAQDSDEEGSTPDGTPADSLPAVAKHSSGSSAEAESPANTLAVPQEDCRPAAWWPRFIGPSTREVSREDTLDCVRLVLTELWGEERAREAPIELEGETVRLSRLYSELERLTGRAGLWDVVQKLCLAARRREGIQPPTGVPLPTRSSYRTTFPWFGEDSGLRRELESEGCWPG
jgi:hypothetical protein